MRTLTEIKRSMLSVSSSDKERNHMDADKLLVEALEVLAWGEIKVSRLRVRQLTKEIIAAYDDISKWYG